MMVTDSKQGGEGEEQDDGDGKEKRKNVSLPTSHPNGMREIYAKYLRSLERQGCKKAHTMNGNPFSSHQIPSKNLTGWLQDAIVGESIVIHTTSELQSILCHPFNVSDCK
ncbi:hypothetical protein Tco_1147169, partial [Tanacetum coccineum]